AGTAERIELKNLAAEAARQLSDLGAGHDVAEIGAAFADLADDEAFWRYQARSLAAFATPDTLTTFRLPNRLVNLVEVSDRFHLKPLLRSVTFPQVAFVLALAQNSVRLLEVVADLEPAEVAVPDLPASAADAVGLSSIKGRAPRRKIQGSEGQKVRLHQYSRQIDRALRPLLNGLDVPLTLSATDDVASYGVVDEIAGRLNWLRAAVLGANDGIVSVAGIVIGVAGATTARGPIFTAGLAGLVGGA